MDEIQIIDQLILDFKNKSLNEADTRYKIIDTILRDVLKWPVNTTDCELIVNGIRADYVLRGKNGKPLLIIESKKTGTYFDLPKNFNSAGAFQKIRVNKLLTDKYVKNAMFQVKEYCEDLGCTYGCVCNGYCWIVFSISSSLAPWKQQPAFVIKDLSFFKTDYTTAVNLIGYSSLIQNSLRQNIGISRNLNSEVFYPKGSITIFDMPVNSNSYANIFNAISRRFLANIPFDDKEFFQKCYVTNKGNFDDLQKNVQGILHDSITPFFKNEGVKNLIEDNKGGTLVIKLEAILRASNLDNTVLLFGGRGSGKSTFIKRLLFHLRPKEIERHSVVALVDLLYSSQNYDELTTEIWKKVLTEIDKDNLLSSDKKALISLFDDRFGNYDKQILQGFEEGSIEYQKLINDFLLESLKDTKYCCERISKYWKGKKRGLIIVLDNMDQLRSELQDVSFLTSIEIAKKLSCIVLISMREERYFDAKAKGVLDAYLVPSFHVTSPVIPDVLSKRLQYILDKVAGDVTLQAELGIPNHTTHKVVDSFLRICLKE